MVPYRHEANIQGREKTVYVVFKYLAKMPAVERGGGGRSNTSPPHPHPNLQLILGYFIQFKDDGTVILLFGVSFMLLVSGGWRIYCREHVRFRMLSFHTYIYERDPWTINFMHVETEYNI
jgi:hypothetical protein